MFIYLLNNRPEFRKRVIGSIYTFLDEISGSLFEIGQYQRWYQINSRVDLSSPEKTAYSLFRYFPNYKNYVSVKVGYYSVPDSIKKWAGLFFNTPDFSATEACLKYFEGLFRNEIIPFITPIFDFKPEIYSYLYLRDYAPFGVIDYMATFDGLATTIVKKLIFLIVLCDEEIANYIKFYHEKTSNFIIHGDI